LAAIYSFGANLHRRNIAKRFARLGLSIIAVGAQMFLCCLSVEAQTPLGAQIDLSGYKLTFDDEFDQLSVSARSSSTRWIAHTPWNGDFGNAAFTDPAPGFPFTIENGVLRIEAQQDKTGHWASGLICSRAGDGPNAHGFAQQYGFFEVRAKLPPGPGMWPAFWLIGVDKSKYSSEIDVMEQYGAFPAIYHVGSQVHRGQAAPQTTGSPITVGERVMTSQFNTYGVSIDPSFIIFYFNRREVWRTVTTPEFQQPFYILVNLALGGGWPIDGAPNPSFMYVDYVRAYEKK
jgi:beta-glucanase (GH16 family)